MSNTQDHLLIRAARGQRTERTPVWFMRQAGRCDPAYRELRTRVDRPLEALFRDPDLAAQITLLPERFGVDAVIIFQDILTLLDPMGAPFVFRPGPRLVAPVETLQEANALSRPDPSKDLAYVGATVRIVRDSLAGKLPVIGFAGAPLTLAFFLLAGKSPMQDASRPRAAMKESGAAFHRLLDKLTEATIDYLSCQIDAGVDAFQLFESIADLLTPQEYEEFAHPCHERIFAELKGRAPGILFVKEREELDLMATSGADVLSIGKCLDLASCRQSHGESIAFQGNLDNELIAHGSFDEIDVAVRECVHAGGASGHILNLNHGLLEQTPLENVERVVRIARETSEQIGQNAVESAGAR